MTTFKLLLSLLVLAGVITILLTDQNFNATFLILLDGGIPHIIPASLLDLRSSRGVYSHSSLIRYHKSYHFYFFWKISFRVSRNGLYNDQYRYSWISCLGSSYVYCGLKR